MEDLTITFNPDGTLTFVPPLADPVTCTAELWAQLEASEHVTIDARDPGTQGQPAVTYLNVMCTSMSLHYQVKTQTADGYVLELAGYSEQ